MSRWRLLVILGVIVGVLTGGVLAYESIGTSRTCQVSSNPQAGTYRAQTLRFGSVTEYCLANPSRLANGIYAAPDGSVWFGEQSLPGLGRLFPNGTVREYPWAGYEGGGTVTGGVRASVWNIKLWNNLIWAADGDGNRLNGLNPLDGSTTNLNTTATFPYLLSLSPDGSMWLTFLSSPAKLGKVGPGMALSIYTLEGMGRKEPIQVQFVNSTSGYLVALNPYNSTDSGLFSFSINSNLTIVPRQVGEGFGLLYPQSLSVAQGKAWVAQHLPSNVVAYDFSQHT